MDLEEEFNLSYIFVAHDLGVVRHGSDRIAVMYLGKIVERSPGARLYHRRIHPYSVALLSAVPIPDPKANAERKPVVLEGDVPSPVDPPPAWHHPRNVDAKLIAEAELAPDSPESASERLPSEAERAPAATR